MMDKMEMKVDVETELSRKSLVDLCAGEMTRFLRIPAEMFDSPWESASGFLAMPGRTEKWELIRAFFMYLHHPLIR